MFLKLVLKDKMTLFNATELNKLFLTEFGCFFKLFIIQIFIKH